MTLQSGSTRRDDASAPSTPTKLAASMSKTPSSSSSTGPRTPTSQHSIGAAWRDFGGVPPAPKAPSRRLVLSSSGRRGRRARQEQQDDDDDDDDDVDDDDGSPTPRAARRLTFGKQDASLVKGPRRQRQTDEDEPLLRLDLDGSSSTPPSPLIEPAWLLPAFGQTGSGDTSRTLTPPPPPPPLDAAQLPDFQQRGGGADRGRGRGQKRRRVKTGDAAVEERSVRPRATRADTANTMTATTIPLVVQRSLDLTGCQTRARRSLRRSMPLRDASCSAAAAAAPPPPSPARAAALAPAMTRSQSATLAIRVTDQRSRSLSTSTLCGARSLYAAAPQSAPLSPLVRPSSSSSPSPMDRHRDYFGPGPWWASSPGHAPSSPRVC